MAGYAMVEALRHMNVERIALNAVYHWPEWWQGTVNFLTEAGFDVVWAGNFVDQVGLKLKRKSTKKDGYLKVTWLRKVFYMSLNKHLMLMFTLLMACAILKRAIMNNHNAPFILR